MFCIKHYCIHIIKQQSQFVNIHNFASRPHEKRSKFNLTTKIYKQKETEKESRLHGVTKCMT